MRRFLCYSDSPREKISRLAVQRHLQKGLEWSSFIHETGQTQLEYKYRVMCNPDYYGPGCSILCKPRDDHFGHYSCNDAGEKVCLSGWKGQYCDEGRQHITHISNSIVYEDTVTSVREDLSIFFRHAL